MRRATSISCLVLIAGLSVGCASGEPKEEERLTEEPDESDEPQTSRTLSEKASEALATCRRDIEAIDGLPRDERVAYAVDVCSGIWLEESCSRSFSEALELPSYQRSGKILRDCRDAYCPTFEPATRDELALCGAPLEDPVSLVQPLRDEAETDPIEAWLAFNDAIFSEVYGVKASEQMVGNFPRMFLSLVVVAPPSSESE